MSLWNNTETNTDRKPTVPMAPPSPERQEPVVAKAPEAAAPQPAAPGSDLLLGRGARFEGKLTFEGTVRIDARFIGSIVTNDVLVVGEAARIDADITCGTIVIHGEVNGNIKAKTAVEIHHTAKVRGDLETPSLAIQKGATFNGASKMDAGNASKSESSSASKSESSSASKAEAGHSKGSSKAAAAAAAAATAAPVVAAPVVAAPAK